MKCGNGLILAGLTLLVAPFSASFVAQAAGLGEVWANDGGVKILREQRPARGNAEGVRNSVWDGRKVKLFGAKNEVLGFNLVLESEGARGARQMGVNFKKLLHSNGRDKIESAPIGNNEDLFKWTERPIELFYVRYLKIEGMSGNFYDFDLDERQIPSLMQLKRGGTTWDDREGAGKSFPEIAVPLELVPQFDIPASSSQSVWVDIYVPRFAVPGLYRGTIQVTEAGRSAREIPIELTVKNFSLPDEPASKTMLHVGYGDINLRYFGKTYPKLGTPTAEASDLVKDRHYMMAHRHKVSLVDNDLAPGPFNYDHPRPQAMARLDGTLFSPMKGYDGPGLYTGNGIYAIGMYGTWAWRESEDEEVMHTRTDNWERWFKRYFPQVERFLYLIDESDDFLKTQRWASWVHSGTGPGKDLPVFATVANIAQAHARIPDLDIISSVTNAADTALTQTAVDEMREQGKKLYLYNAKRPQTGTFATEDDGTALRELAWGQFKKGIERWFFWESTYYNNYQGGIGETNVFASAQTFGAQGRVSAEPRAISFGKTSRNYSNGDGVLFYPGTDVIYPEDNYDARGPIASLRLKHWRRGIQDMDYVTLAMRVNPTRTMAIVNRMVPKALWENGSETVDSHWVRGPISWSIDPDDWERARAELADLIER